MMMMMMMMSSRFEFSFFFPSFSLETNESREWAGYGMAWHAHKCFEQDRKGKEKGERKEHVTAGSAHTRSGIPFFFYSRAELCHGLTAKLCMYV